MTPKKEALNFLVSADLKNRLRTYAQQHGISISDAVRLMLTQALNKTEGRPR